MVFHKHALKSYLLAAALATCPTTQAFAPAGPASHKKWSSSSKTLTLPNGIRGPSSYALSMVATTPADLGMNVDNTGNIMGVGGPSSSSNNGDDQNGAMVDLKGIVFSGLKGKALSLKAEDFPKSKDIKAVIPADCFEPETLKSLGYLSVSLVGTGICTAVGVAMLSAIGTSIWTLPIWTIYSAITGTVAMGLWVLAHECGHGAFSKNRKLQDAVGYTLHSLMLVPYFSWQRSHAVHHQYTNHMELGETHVPEEYGENGTYQNREKVLEWFGPENGIKVWGGIQGFLHLVVG
eukprot:CAMPEP_0176502596 /NCGR_PEP_ID=MMETSP0200_2-20121128/14840_1 /TAXON_ID=947934 /ORGANISM="Chaetoceros sp., Strain GSL56" /LENGTH=291 /DNA_ID=CAMNT_0017901683 /DNA_START=6 /DNA_END=877 /DNA_ORIENTATION=-